MNERRPPRRPRLEPEEEVLHRMRRIETRVTQIAMAMGVGVPTDRPIFTREHGGVSSVKVPSPNASIKEILDSIPVTCDGPVEVFVGGDLVATIGRPGNRP